MIDDDLTKSEPTETPEEKIAETEDNDELDSLLLDLFEQGGVEKALGLTDDDVSALLDEGFTDTGEAKETPVEAQKPAVAEEAETMAESSEETDDGSAWYVVHTFSGYENKVQDGLERLIEHSGMSDKIKEVRIPTREVKEEKNGKTVITQKKLFPGYVIVRMIMDDDAWYFVRNQRGVTGFVGPNGQKPIPLTQQELDNMGVIKLDKKKPLFAVGDPIEVIDGALKGEVTVIEEVLEDTKEVKIRTSILGVNTSTIVGFDRIRKIEI